MGACLHACTVICANTSAFLRSAHVCVSHEDQKQQYMGCNNLAKKACKVQNAVYSLTNQVLHQKSSGMFLSMVHAAIKSATEIPTIIDPVALG